MRTARLAFDIRPHLHETWAFRAGAIALLLLAAWGVAHTTRGIGALVLQPLVLAGAVIPFLRPMLLVEPTVLLLLVVATVGVVLLAARIYTGALLRMGGRVKIGEALRAP